MDSSKESLIAASVSLVQIGSDDPYSKGKDVQRLRVIVDGVEQVAQLRSGDQPSAAAQAFCTKYSIGDPAALATLTQALAQLRSTATTTPACSGGDCDASSDARQRAASQQENDVHPHARNGNVRPDSGGGTGIAAGAAKESRPVEQEPPLQATRTPGSAGFTSPSVAGRSRVDGAARSPLERGSPPRTTGSGDPDGADILEREGDKPKDVHTENERVAGDMHEAKAAGNLSARTVEEVAAAMRAKAQDLYNASNPHSVLVDLNVNGIAAPLIFEPRTPGKVMPVEGLNDQISGLPHEVDITRQGRTQDAVDGKERHSDQSVMDLEMTAAAEVWCGAFGSALPEHISFVKAEVLKAWKAAAALRNEVERGGAESPARADESARGSARNEVVRRGEQRETRRLTSITLALAPDVEAGTNVFWVKDDPRLPASDFTAGSSALEPAECWCELHEQSPSQVPLVAWKVLEAYPMQMHAARHPLDLPPTRSTFGYAVHRRETQCAILLAVAAWGTRKWWRKRELSKMAALGWMGLWRLLVSSTPVQSLRAPPLCYRCGKRGAYARLLRRLRAAGARRPGRKQAMATADDGEGRNVGGRHDKVVGTSAIRWRKFHLPSILAAVCEEASSDATNHGRSSADVNAGWVQRLLFNMGWLTGAVLRVVLRVLSSKHWASARSRSAPLTDTPAAASGHRQPLRRSSVPEAGYTMHEASEAADRDETAVSPELALGQGEEASLGTDVSTGSTERYRQDAPLARVVASSSRPTAEGQPGISGCDKTWRRVLERVENDASNRFAQVAFVSTSGHILAKSDAFDMDTHEACDWIRLHRNKKNDIVVGGVKFQVVSREEGSIIATSKTVWKKIVGYKTKSGSVVLGTYNDLSRAEARESIVWLAQALNRAPVR